MAEKRFEQDQEEFFRKTENFAQQLNAANHYYTQGEKYNTDYSALVNEFGRKLTDTKDYFAKQHAQIAEQEREARLRATADDEFVRNAERNIAEKNTERQAREEVYNQQRNRLVEELKTLDVKKLGKFKVKDQTQLHTFFSGIHSVFYHDQGDFDWAKFKSAFEKDKGAALQTRLGTPDFSTLTQSRIETLTRLRNDPFYAELAGKPKEGAALLPLVNYLNVIVPAAEAYNDHTRLQREIAEIETQRPLREESARVQYDLANDLQASLKYLNSVNERFVSNLEPFKNEGQRKAEYEELFRGHLRRRQDQLENYARVIQSTR